MSTNTDRPAGTRRSVRRARRARWQNILEANGFNDPHVRRHDARRPGAPDAPADQARRT